MYYSLLNVRRCSSEIIHHDIHDNSPPQKKESDDNAISVFFNFNITASEDEISSNRVTNARLLEVYKSSSETLVCLVRLESFSTKIVVLKIFKTDGPMKKSAANKFHREFTCLSSVRHRGIVKLLGWGTERGRPTLILEPLSGGTLKDRIKECNDCNMINKQFRLIYKFTWASQVANAVRYLHRNKILWRDIKAEHIMFRVKNNYPGDVVIVDLKDSCCMISHDGDDIKANRDSDDKLIGLPNYVAPELLYHNDNFSVANNQDIPSRIRRKHIPRCTKYRCDLLRLGDTARQSVCLKCGYNDMTTKTSASDRLVALQSYRDFTASISSMSLQSCPSQLCECKNGRCDIWGLGCILLDIFGTEESHPFVGWSRHEIAMKLCGNCEPPEVPTDLVDSDYLDLMSYIDYKGFVCGSRCSAAAKQRLTEIYRSIKPKLVRIIVRCLHMAPDLRPEAEEIFEALHNMYQDVNLFYTRYV